MALADSRPADSALRADPKSVKVRISEGTGMDIDWKDGHKSAYTFAFLRDACPCALCNEEREKSGREPGEAPKLVPGALPMFKATAKPTTVEPGNTPSVSSGMMGTTRGFIRGRFCGRIAPARSARREGSQLDRRQRVSQAPCCSRWHAERSKASLR
jgi:hypothetical protein